MTLVVHLTFKEKLSQRHQQFISGPTEIVLDWAGFGLGFAEHLDYIWRLELSGLC